MTMEKLFHVEHEDPDDLFRRAEGILENVDRSIQVVGKFQFLRGFVFGVSVSTLAWMALAIWLL